MGAMAFVAALPEVLALGETAAAAGGAAEGAAAGGGAAAEAGGGAGGSGLLGSITKSKIMPIPHMGSNGGSKSSDLGPTNSYLNADQFR